MQCLPVRTHWPQNTSDEDDVFVRDEPRTGARLCVIDFVRADVNLGTSARVARCGNPRESDRAMPGTNNGGTTCLIFSDMNIPEGFTKPNVSDS